MSSSSTSSWASRLGRHVDGLVDAYYGPAELQDEDRATAGAAAPTRSRRQARELIAELDGGGGEADLDANRRSWLRAQLVGLETTAEKLGGEPIAYVDEVERCYGVRPTLHRRVGVRGRPPEARRRRPRHRARSPTRYIAWRESQAVPVEKLDAALHSLAEDFRERTQRLFGLPDGEKIEWLLETDKPWSGFNYYLGGLRSRVAINTDLPVLSTSLGHLVAHEAYPGHHTEHTRKEVGLVRRHGHLEETIFLVGTPQCLLAEGLADLGIEVLLGPDHEPLLAEHLRPLGIPYDTEVIAAVRQAGETLGAVRGNAAWLLHEDGRPPAEVVELPRALVAAATSAGREGGRVPHRSHVAGLHLLLHRGPAPVPRLRGRRPGALRAPADRAAGPGDLVGRLTRRPRAQFRSAVRAVVASWRNCSCLWRY